MSNLRSWSVLVLWPEKSRRRKRDRIHINVIRIRTICPSILLVVRRHWSHLFFYLVIVDPEIPRHCHPMRKRYRH